jgi:Zn-dependent membrane protease YugP
MRDWAAFVGLFLLGVVLRNLISAAYARIRKRIDDAVPDHLPVGGEGWLRERLPAGVRVLVTRSHDENSYMPDARLITLSSDVAHKRDASFWATAAHELGHALFYRTTVLVHGVFFLGRSLVMACTAAGTFLVVANVLYARADVNHIAFTLLEVSLAAWLLVLLDEAIASVIGLRLLIGDKRLSVLDIVGALTSLAAAWMTYAGAFVGQVILVMQREFVVGMIERHRHFTPAPPMGTAKAIAVVVLAALLALWSVRNVVRGLGKRAATTSEEVTQAMARSLVHDWGRAFLGGLIVWLVWDQPGDLVPLVTVVGLLGSRTPIRAVFSLVGGLFIRLLVWVLFWPIYALVVVFMGLAELILDRPAFKFETETPYFPPPDSVRTKDAFAKAEVDAYNDASLTMRVRAITSPLLHLAFAAGLVAVVITRG